MYALLPSFTLRAPLAEDAQIVTELFIARDIDDSGRPGSTIQDVLSAWRRKDFNPETDAWMVFAQDGTLAAYADLWVGQDRVVRLNNNSTVHPSYRNQGIEDWMMDRAEEWAREHATDGKIVIRHVVNDAVPQHVERMTRWGYQPVRHAWLMEIQLDQAPPAPQVSEEIVLRPFQRGRDERAAWATIQEAFRDLWQHADSPYDEWSNVTVANTAFSPDLSYLAWDGDELAGATIVINDELGGWVQQVAVRRPWRGRGIGLALLHTVFGELYKLGVPTAGLEVDSQNPSGALHLYERAGMHMNERFTEFRKELERVALPA